MDEMEYMAQDATGLAALIAAGEVTSREALDAARGRAARVNPLINAICTPLDDHADRRVEHDLSGPFAGVPFLLKDLLQDLAGTPTAAGCRALSGTVSAETSTVVQRFLDAGLVAFGRTTTPEFGSKGVTESALHGATRNPWDLERTPGGSSGGSAAAVAAGIVPAASASDGGGSIRIPAACTGLVGLKAGRGMVPFGPSDSEPLNGIATHGVVSRTVRDSAALLQAIAGPDACSPYAPALPDGSLLDRLECAPERLRVGYSTRSAIRGEAHPEATRAVQRAAELLTELGHHVEEVDPPHDDRRLAQDFLTIWFVHQALEVARIKRDTGATDRDFELDTLFMAAIGTTFSATELQAADERRHQHIAGLASLHRTHDLLLTPTLGEPPLRIGALDLPSGLQRAAAGVLRTRTTRLLKRTGALDQIIERNLSWVPYTQLANVTGRPAISLPLHWTDDGLPMGVQFVGRLGAERLLLRLARQLELAAPWEDRRPALSPIRAA